MTHLELHTRRLFDLIQEASEKLIPLYSIGGSQLLIQEDDEEQDPAKRYYAAVVVLMDYGSTPEQAIETLVAKVKRQVHGEQKEEPTVLPEDGEAKPG